MRTFLTRKKGDQKCESEREYPQEKAEVDFSAMYRFADYHDKVFIVLGLLCAMCNGVALPVTILILVDTSDDVQDVTLLSMFLDAIPGYLSANGLSHEDVLQDPSLLRSPCNDGVFNTTQFMCDMVDLSSDTLSDKILTNVIMFAVVGCVAIFLTTCQVLFLGISSQKQAIRIRRASLANILQQEMGWFDTTDPVELTSRLSSNISRIQSGIGNQVGMAVYAVATYILCTIVSFTKAWKMTLALLSSMPLLTLVGGLLAYVAFTMTTKQQNANARANVTAKEVFSSIRTVLAFGGEEKETKRYRKLLDEIERLGIKKYFWIGFIFGALTLVNFSSYALGIWYGGRLARHDDNTPTDVATVFFCMATGTMSLSAMAMGLESIQDGREAAYHVFQMIDRVLSGIDIDIRAGQTVALVGMSSQGSSTLMKMLMRFYDPDNGEILLDGHDLRDINVRWLRQSIGFVSQEPVLFDATIAENIIYGRDGVTEEEIFQATKEANAYGLIAAFPKRLYTNVGKGGVQLSRGQKMRIAIARALVRNPKVLLLDNVTTALGEEEISIVQDSLDKARQGRTTVVITDRPSIIRTSDLIVVVEDGRIKEKGSFDQLMASQTFFYNYFMNQIQALGEMEEFVGGNDDDEDTLNKTPMLHSKAEVSEKPLLTTSEESCEEHPEVTWLQILRLNSPEWKHILLGFLAAAIMGIVQFAFAYVFSEVLEVFNKKGQDQKDDIRKYSLCLVGLGFLAVACATVQSWSFGVAGEALTKRLRQSSFAAILRQEMAWFGKQCNSAAALVDRLEKDTSLVREGTTTPLGMLTQCICAMIAMVVFIATFSFQVASLTVGMYFLILTVGLIHMILMKRVETQRALSLHGADNIAREAVEKITTVTLMTEEDTFYMMYSQKLDNLLKNKYWDTLRVGIVLAVVQSLVFFTPSVVFWLEGRLADHDDLDPKDIYEVLTLALFGSFFMSQAVVVVGDNEKAKSAVRRIFQLLERQTNIDTESPSGMKPAKNFFKGAIEVQKGLFYNPAHEDVPVLQNMNFTAEPGQTVALVGSRGRDAGAVFSLLERFYDFDGGNMNINNYDINDVNIKWLRAQIGLVSQKPLLFDCSIADNIAYGDNSRVVPMDEIIRAARQANIHNFIQGLPNGYDTNIGKRGTQLSDSQKQRLAIARVLVRDPPILLLSEPTFVSDDKREQEAIITAQEGRTCIVIAERLLASTIQNADKILVAHGGRIVEEGTHDELLTQNGFYTRLLKMQNLH